MLTKKVLRENGIRYKQLIWKYMPRGYELETSEFSSSGEFWKMSYYQYLTYWKFRLNKNQTRERYSIIKTWLKNDWHITLVEILEVL